jgi:hypothetical protein
MATGLWDGRPGVRFLIEARFFFCKSPDRVWGPPILLFGGYRRSCLWIKQSGSEVNRSSPSSAKVKNRWSYLYAHIYPHGVDREDVTFLTTLIIIIIIIIIVIIIVKLPRIKVMKTRRGWNVRLQSLLWYSARPERQNAPAIFYPEGNSLLLLISVRCCVDPRGIERGQKA